MSLPLVRAKCQQLRSELDTLLATLGEKLGMKIAVNGAMKYDASTITLKIVANLPNPASPTGEIETLEAKDFKANVWKWGLQATDLGRTFHVRGDAYTIIGAKPRSDKFPILGKRADGKIYKFAPHQIVGQLHPAKADSE